MNHEPIPMRDHGPRSRHRFEAILRTAAGAPYSLVTNHDGEGIYLLAPDGELTLLVPPSHFRALNLADFQAVVDKHHQEAQLKIAAARALADAERRNQEAR